MFHYDPDVDGKDIKDLFDKLYKHVKFDKKLLKQLLQFRLDWINKGPEYSEFLGGNSIGVHKIRFSARDDVMLMADIYGVDINTVFTNIKKVPGMITDKGVLLKVASNPVSQTLCYTMHRFIKDGKLGRDLEEGIKTCYFIFSYKILGSLLSNYFVRPSTPAVAKAVHERLSNRYLIKKLGTWNDLLDYRTKVVLPKGLHYERLIRYSTDDSIRIISGMQGSIRENIKAVYDVLVKVEESNDRVVAASATEENESGESTSKAITDRPDKYVNNIKELMGSDVNLIDEDILYLVSKLVNSTDTDTMRETILYLHDMYDPRHIKKTEYLEHIILKTIGYCNLKGINGEYRNNIIDVVQHMKGYWSSGSVKDSDVKQTKHFIEKAVKEATGRRTKWVISANALGVIVYLFVRSVK